MVKSRAATNFEYGALRLFCALVNAVPYSLAMAAARGLAAFAFDVLRFKRKRTLDRIAKAFPEKPPREIRAVARRSLANVAQSAVEMIRAPRFDKAWMDRHVVDGQLYKDRLQELVDEGNGVVIMVPHSGNWYMAAWSMAKYGLPLFALAARQRNVKIDAWMKRQYGDIEVLDRSDRNTLARIKDKLKSGRAFAILPDLRVNTPDVEVDFLGGKANVSHAGAMFAVGPTRVRPRNGHRWSLRCSWFMGSAAVGTVLGKGGTAWKQANPLQPSRWRGRARFGMTGHHSCCTPGLYHRLWKLTTGSYLASLAQSIRPLISGCPV